MSLYKCSTRWPSSSLYKRERDRESENRVVANTEHLHVSYLAS